jgi:hypothetical protein
MLQLNGHSSRLTPAVAERLIAYNICAFIIPSHTSTIHQAADNGLQALTQRLYETEVVVVIVFVSVCLIYYQLDIKITANPQRAITTTDIITCIVNVVEQFKTKQTTFKASFARVGVVEGAPDCTRFTPATYAIGAPYRDISLPKVTPALLSQVSCVFLFS